LVGLGGIGNQRLACGYGHAADDAELNELGLPDWGPGFVDFVGLREGARCGGWERLRAANYGRSMKLSDGEPNVASAQEMDTRRKMVFFEYPIRTVMPGSLPDCFSLECRSNRLSLTSRRGRKLALATALGIICRLRKKIFWHLFIALFKRDLLTRAI
jgi:hypothetical protein